MDQTKFVSNFWVIYSVVIRCLYDEHPLASRDIQHRAPDSRSRRTTPFDDIIDSKG